MPTIATLGGIGIYIYNTEHNPPHIHAYAAEWSGIFRIADSVMTAGDLPTKDQRKVRRWLDDNRDFAAQKWRELTQG
jgi:hypothetical protein